MSSRPAGGCELRQLGPFSLVESGQHVKQIFLHRHVQPPARFYDRQDRCHFRSRLLAPDVQPVLAFMDHCPPDRRSERQKRKGRLTSPPRSSKQHSTYRVFILTRRMLGVGRPTRRVCVVCPFWVDATLTRLNTGTRRKAKVSCALALGTL